MRACDNPSTDAAASSLSSGEHLWELIQPVRSELDLVEQELASNLIDDNRFTDSILIQIFQSGGKRLRPALVLLSAYATMEPDLSVDERHITLAVLTELIHTASLVHDDVIDRAATRRGAETVNRRWNDRLAILVGDLLFAQASICLARLAHPVIVGIYGRVLGDLCAGEIRQMEQRYVCRVDWEGYIAKSIAKTGSLFSAGCRASAILNESQEKIVSIMGEYGLNLGICFQIVDDLLDVTQTSEKLGKPAGSDLAGGVVTAPALSVLERDDSPGQRLRRLIETRAVCQEEGMAEALAIIRTTGGIEATVGLAKRYGEAARAALSGLRTGAPRDSLAGIVDYILSSAARP